MNDQVDESTPDASSKKPVKAALVKVIPTDRVSFEKQMSALRAYAAASGREKKAVSNDEVSKVMSELVASSISLCNPFFADAGLLIPEGRKQRPADAVFDFQHAFEWKPETAGHKLRPIFADHWAAKTLLPKLSFRTLTKDEAIAFLAEESKATTGHKKNLETLLEFLNASGVLRVEGNTLSKAATSNDGDETGKKDPPPPPPPLPPHAQGNAGGRSSQALEFHPFVQGLLDKLPAPDSDWPKAGRVKWLQTAANIFDLIYTDEEEVNNIKVSLGDN